MTFLDTFLKPPLLRVRARTINNDIAILNVGHTSTHCAKLAKYAGVSWHWAGGAERKGTKGNEEASELVRGKEKKKREKKGERRDETQRCVQRGGCSWPQCVSSE